MIFWNMRYGLRCAAKTDKQLRAGLSACAPAGNAEVRVLALVLTLVLTVGI